MPKNVHSVTSFGGGYFVYVEWYTSQTQNEVAQNLHLLNGISNFLVGMLIWLSISKDGKQIADVPNAFIAADGIEYALGNKIPLWLFGFLY